MSGISSRKIKVLFLSVGNFLTSISSLLLTIALTRLFSIDQYGDYRQTLLVFNMFAPLLLFGFDKSIFYFFSQEGINKKNDYRNLQLFLLLTNILYVLAFIFGGANFISLQFNNPSIKEFLILYSIISLFEIPTRLLTPVLVIQEKIKLLTIFNIIYRLLFFIGSVLLAIAYKEVRIVLVFQVVLALLAFLVSQSFINKALPSETKFSFDFSIIKRYLYIGIPLSIATIMGYLGKNIDKALISHYLTKVDFAYYVNGAIEIPLIASITGAIMTILLADFAILYQKNDYQEIFRLWSKSVKYTSSILVFIMFLLLINAEFLITTMYGQEYISSTKPFMVYLLLLPIRTMVFSSLITVTSKTKYILYGAILYLAFNVIFSIVLIKEMGFIGPAVATVISTYLLGIFYSFVIMKQYQVSFFKVFNIYEQRYFLIAGLIPFIILNFVELSSLTVIQSLIVRNSIFVIISGSLILLFKEQKVYIEMFKMLKNRK
ncbi:MAG: O-antigen/teichoic acid export membrane protein [Planctomycetota bacterium]|jgi:O-antigen/teichoic acid export membrane protein